MSSGRSKLVKGQQMERPKPIACIKTDLTIKEVLHYIYNHPAVRRKGGELFLYSLPPHNNLVRGEMFNYLFYYFILICRYSLALPTLYLPFMWGRGEGKGLVTLASSTK